MAEDKKEGKKEEEDKAFDLVLSGGGVRGQGVVGAVVALDDAGRKVHRVAGTSAGAITAALVAAIAARNERERMRDPKSKAIPMRRLWDYMLELDNVRFMDWATPGRLAGPVHGAVDLFHRGGLFRADYLYEWLTPILDDLGVRTFRDLRFRDEGADPGSPGAQHRSDDPKPWGLMQDRLVLHATDLSRRALVRLPWDYPLYGLNPNDQLIVDAVRASMSIPLFFRPVRVQSARGPVTWLDGGVLANFPLTVFDRTDNPENVRFPTWGVRIVNRPLRRERAIRSALGVGLGLVKTVKSDWYRVSFGSQGAGRRTIEVDVPGVKSTGFDVEPKTIKRIFNDGYTAGLAFLDVVDPQGAAAAREARQKALSLA